MLLPFDLRGGFVADMPASLFGQPPARSFSLMATSLVRLKEGTQNPPIFLAPGGGSNISDYRKLACEIRTLCPIFGMAGHVAAQFRRVEDMAESHLEAVKSIQPSGPYYLIGYSLGGLVALEMAQRLLAKGEEIGLLVMIETYPYKRFLSIGQRFRRLLRSMRFRGSIALGVRRALSVPSHGLNVQGAATGNTGQCYYDRLAWMNYRPRRYKGTIKFIQAETTSFFPDAAAFWTKLTDDFAIENAVGDHLGIIENNAASVASMLSRCIAEGLG